MGQVGKKGQITRLGDTPCTEALNESLRILRELKEEGLAEAVKGENGWDIDWIEGNGEEGNMFGLSKDEMKSISPIKRNGCS